MDEIFKKIYNLSNIPDPLKVHSTRWNLDEFAYGSYSARGVGVTVEDIEQLGTPEGNGTLLFAGEATSPNFWGYVHGGFLTGLREAYRILKDADLISRYFSGDSVWRRVAKTEIRQSNLILMLAERMKSGNLTVDQLFRQLDINNDGTLQKEEVMKAIKQGHHIKAGQHTMVNDIEFLFKALDIEGDNNLSLEEFSAAFESAIAAQDEEEDNLPLPLSDF